MAWAPLAPDSVDLRVFTFKDGVLSRVAHDLQLRAHGVRVEVDVEKDAVRAHIDASSLRVVCTMKKGREQHGEPSAKDKAEIERNLRGAVLGAGEHPEITFEGTGLAGGTLEGELTLHGARRPLQLAWRREGARRTAEVRLDHRDWGIQPYRALMGALKVQPVVTVVVSFEWNPANT